MSIADEILTVPYRRKSFLHWFEKLSLDKQVQCLIVWATFHREEIDIPMEELGNRIKDAYPEIDVTGKQITVWLKDKKGWDRATDDVKKEAKTELEKRKKGK